MVLLNNYLARMLTPARHPQAWPQSLGCPGVTMSPAGRAEELLVRGGGTSEIAHDDADEKGDDDMLEEDDNDDMEEYLAAGSSDHAGNPPVSQPHACWDTQENNFKVPLGRLTYRQI